MRILYTILNNILQKGVGCGIYSSQMPKEANVMIIDDSSEMVEFFQDKLEEGKHRVVGVARNRSEAIELIGKIRELGANVVAVDGNLLSGDESGRDGKLIVKAIRADGRNKGVKCLGISTSGNVEGADRNLRIEEFYDISEVVDQL
jgi:CheY-like chemotaxis protein